MSRQTKQTWSRRQHIVAMLKENCYPNHPRIVEKLRSLDPAGTYTITQKTIQRDLDYLKNELHAPIKYDYAHKGYYLTDPNWYMELPSLMTKDLESIAFSATLAEQILPAAVASKMREAIDSFFAACNTGITDDRTDMLSIIATGSQVPLNQEIVAQVFHAWQIRHLIRLTYASAKAGGKLQEKLVEPQALAYHNNIWYLIVKQRQLLNAVPDEKDIKSLAIHRIRKAEQLPQMFETDPQLVKAAHNGKIFNFPTVDHVILKLTNKSIIYGQERFPQAQFTSQPDGSVTMRLSSIEQYDIMNFVLTWAGEVTVQAPQVLVEAVTHAASKILTLHQTQE